MIDYSKLPRLAELCELISDKDVSGDEKIDAQINLRVSNYGSKLQVLVNSWTGFLELSIYYIQDCTIDEMIATLEQIEACEFRDLAEVAA